MKSVGPEARKTAAAKWIADFTQRQIKLKGRVQKALAVLLLDTTTSAWLAENDPVALSQGQKALSGTDYVAFL